MNELREVVEMVTKQAEPSRDSWTEQERRQQRAARNRKIGAIGLAAALIAVAVVFAVTNLGDGKDGTLVPTPANTGQPNPSGSEAPLGLAIVGLDGTVQQDLGLPTDAWMPDLSADGSQVMFITRSPEMGFCGGCAPQVDRLAVLPFGETHGIFIMWASDFHLTQVEEPVWSPDGSRIAFVGVSRSDGDRDIYVADLLGPDAIPNATLRRVTSDPAVDEFPAWSPDGSTIFYDNGGAEPLDGSGFSSTQEIWSVPAEGGSPQRLTHNKVADAMPDVATDGTVAFWRGGDIWTMDQQGDNQERLKVVPGETGFNPRWSPDGSMMALLRFDPASFVPISDLPGRPLDMPTLEVVVVDLATGEVTTVGPRVAADYNPVSWMPDGSALLINRYDAGG
jgi:hypothetical protein